MYKNLINYLRNFKNIAQADEDKILNACSKKKYKRGEWISKVGKIGEKLYYIEKGILNITTFDGQENEITYFFLEENQFMPFLYSIYGSVPAQQGLLAGTDIELIEIKKADLFMLYQEIPYFRGLIDQIAHLSMSNMINLKNIYLGGTAVQKYELFLKQQPEVAIRAMQMDIASYLSITPQSLSRIRKKVI